jgi:glycosyltransferase domain-containing protein
MRLTVIVPVIGSPFIDRFIRQKTPYEICFVPNKGGKEYFTKVADALKRVTTPYVMRADDDDFLGIAGIERCLDFLDTNPDYVAASGLVGGFSVRGPAAPLYGAINRQYKYYRAEDLSQATAHDRLIAGANKLWMYYAIHRTPTLQTVTRDIADIGFSDLLLYEFFHTARTLSLGKVHLDDKCISYFRQYGTSTSGPSSRTWNRRFLRSSFTADVERIRSIIGDDAVLGPLAEKLRQFLRANNSIVQHYKWKAQDRWPKVYSWWQNRRRFPEWKFPVDELQKFLEPPIAGVGGLCADPSGHIAGDKFPSSPFDAHPADVLFKYRIKGERWGMTLTEALRRYPLPKVPGHYVPEGLTDLQMPYRRRYANKVLRIYYPSPKGLDRTKPGNAGRLYYYRWILHNRIKYAVYAPLQFLKAALMLLVLK